MPSKATEKIFALPNQSSFFYIENVSKTFCRGLHPCVVPFFPLRFCVCFFFVAFPPRQKQSATKLFLTDIVAWGSPIGGVFFLSSRHLSLWKNIPRKNNLRELKTKRGRSKGERRTLVACGRVFPSAPHKNIARTHTAASIRTRSSLYQTCTGC